MTKNEPTTKNIGNQFEAYIGTLYQSLGYRVSYNQLLSGKQVDILAEKMIAGAGLSKLAIECKYQSKGNIGNEKIYAFMAASQPMLKNDGITKSILITNTGFTDTGSAAADNNQQVLLITQRSLEDQLFDLGSTYKPFVDIYETKDIFTEYVALNGIYSDEKEEKIKIENIEQFLKDWLSKPQDRLLTIFGDFGSGKTTVLNRIKYVFAKAYIEGKSLLKPFLVNLKEFYKYDTLDKLLTYSAIREFEREVSLELVYRQIETGQIILLLDGFDEMAQQIDTEIRMKNFLTLAPLLRQRTIITCRPSYFISKNEYIDFADQLFEKSALKDPDDQGTYKRENMGQRETFNKLSLYLSQEFVFPNRLRSLQILDIQMIEILNLSTTSIDELLERNDQKFKKVLGYGWQIVKEYLMQIYDISDLMTRPMLLQMIIKTLLSGHLELKGSKPKVGPAELYELYTSTYLEMDFQKGDSRQLFTATQRRSLAISIALLMFEQRSLEVSYEKLMEFISKHPDLKKIIGNIDGLSFEQIVADIQICSFLVSSESGNFKFAHKSFMEFFVARYLKQKMLGAKTPPEFSSMLPKEILYFLGSYRTMYHNVSLKFNKWLEIDVAQTRNDVLRRNAASAILYGGKLHEGIVWKELEISYIEFKNKTLQRAEFERVNILHVDFISANFYNNQWRTVHLKHVNFRSCEVHGSMWSTISEEMQMSGGVLSNCNLSISGKTILLDALEIKDCSMSFSGNAEIKNCKFYSGSVNWQTTFSGEIYFQECIFDHGKIIWPVKGSIINYKFSKCKFKSHHIELLDNGLPSKLFDQCWFEKCKLENFRLDVYSVKNTTFIDCSGYVLLEDRAVKEKQLEPFKQMGNLAYFKKGELYYIPQETWEKCGRDIKTFQTKINAKLGKEKTKIRTKKTPE